MDSDLNGAKTELQKLRNARNAKEALIANSPAELEDVIVNDARREFMCEGADCFISCKRLGRKVVDESGKLYHDGERFRITVAGRGIGIR